MTVTTKGLPLAALVLALAACQTNPPLHDDIDRALDTSNSGASTAPRSAVNAPAEVNAALLPPLASPSTTPPLAPREQRFDIAVKEASARDFFMGLVEGTPYNMLVHPGVEGTITLSLRNVSVSEVMEAVRNVYGYDFTYRSGIYEVLPAGLATRFFPINYLNLRRLGESRTRVNSGQLVDNNNGSGGNGNNNNSSNGNGGSTTNVAQIPSTEIKTDTDADLWGELGASLKMLIGEGDGRQVITSPQTGVVIVRAPARDLRAVEDFLTRAQLNLQRQVVLEARILEVQLSDGFQSGINWSKLGSINGNPFNLGISGTSLGGVTPGLPQAGPVTATEANPLGGVFAGTYSSGSFDGVVELLKTQGNVSVLSSPHVSTINNQKAVIKVGSDEFFVTSISSNNTTSANGTNQVNPTVTLTPFFSGIALDVTPQISDAGDITLHVHPSVSKVVDQTKQLRVFGQDTTLPLALSTTRESDSIVRAKSGQVVVIGGLIQNEGSDSEAGTPGLSKVPVLGYLFKQNRNSTKKSELVILLRPVVANDDSWEEQVRATRARFKDLDYPLDTSFKP